MEQGKHTPIPWRYQTEVGLPPGMPRIRRAQIYTNILNPSKILQQTNLHSTDNNQAYLVES